MSALSPSQSAALASLARGPFIKSVAGWHRQDDCLHAFHTQTMAVLEGHGLAQIARRSARITARGARFLRAEAEAARVAS